MIEIVLVSMLCFRKKNKHTSVSRVIFKVCVCVYACSMFLPISYAGSPIEEMLWFDVRFKENVIAIEQMDE